MAQKVWLVTGCSSGFGAAFVRAILARGDKAIATARVLSTLEPLRVIGAACMHLDICDSPEELIANAQEAETIYGRVDVLINNAGYAQLGALEETSPDTLKNQFKTNVFGTMNLTRAFLPFFRARKSGTIVMISSVDAWVGRAGFGAYTASKYALEGLTDCLREELSPHNIKTLIVEPGTFRTSALTPKTLQIKPAKIPAYNELHESLMSIFDLHGSEPGDPAKMAERVVDLVKAEGTASGKPLPTRIMFGRDALEEVKEECIATLKIIEDWEQVITSTDFDPEPP